MKKIFTLLLSVSICILAGAAAPTVPASNLKFSNLDGASFDISCTAGNGQSRIVVMKEGSPVTGMPVNGVEYSANSKFGTPGSEFTAPGEYVVFKTGWASFSPTNFKPGTTYYVAVFEYNGTTTATQYLAVSLTGSQSTVTTPTVQASSMAFANVTGNSVQLSWAKGNGNGRIVLMRKGAPVNATPLDLKSYFAADLYYEGDKLNTDNIVVYKGGGAAVTVNRLEPNTTYYFSVFEYNGSVTPLYLSAAATATVTTNAGPTVGPSYITFDDRAGGDRLTVGCGLGNGNGRIIIAKKEAPVTAVPVNGETYTANAQLGAGTEIAPGEFVVSNGSASSITVTNLEPATVYYFRVYELDKTQSGYTYFLTSAYKEAGQSTARPPSVLSSNFKITSLTGSAATIAYTPGNGAWRLAVMKEGSAVDAVPADLTLYPGNSNYGSGTQIAAGNYVVAGSTNGASISVAALKPGMTYYLAVFDYNGTQVPVYNKTGGVFSFSVPAEPTTASGSFSQLSKEGNAMRVSWTNGNGARRIVIAKKEAPVTAKPVDGTFYTPNDKLGLGTAIATGEYVVYDGTGNYFDLNNLEIGTTYHFAVFEYNVPASGAPDYLTTTYLASSAATYSWPTVQTSGLNATTIQATQAAINFTKGNGAERMFILRAGAPVDAEPQDLVRYNYNTIYGSSRLGSSDSYVVYKTSSVSGSFTVTGLSPNTTYYGAAFEYNGNTGTAYLRPGSTFSFTTSDVPGATTPTIASSSPAFSAMEGNKLTFGWTNGNGANHLVVMRQGSAVDFVPANTTSYPANASFGGGTNLGAGQYAVYNGSGNSVTVTSLQPSTTYYFTVYEYNGSGTTLRYLTSAVLAASSATATAPATGSSNAAAVTSGTNLTLNWTSGNGYGRLVVLKEGSAVTAAPVDLSVYPANAVWGNGAQLATGEYVVYTGAGNTVTVSGLSGNKTYYYTIFEYNGNTAPVYNTSNALSGSALIGTPLPVQWLSFTAQEKNRGVELKWATAQEVNTDHFVVEKSTDGSAFTAVATVAAAGYSATSKEYTYMDGDPFPGTVYYRIQQMDKDGKYEYSQVVSVKNTKSEKSKLSVYPNPARDVVSIRLSPSSTGARLTIYDVKGAMVLQQTISSQQPINISTLKPGLYFLVVKEGNLQTTERLIKQ